MHTDLTLIAAYILRNLVEPTTLEDFMSAMSMPAEQRIELRKLIEAMPITQIEDHIVAVTEKTVAEHLDILENL